MISHLFPKYIPDLDYWIRITQNFQQFSVKLKWRDIEVKNI